MPRQCLKQPDTQVSLKHASRIETYQPILLAPPLLSKRCQRVAVAESEGEQVHTIGSGIKVSDEIQDEELVRRIRMGDRDQFEVLAKRYASKIYGLAMRLTRNPWDAKDLVQEIFLLVYTKLDGFRGESAFGTWLYKVALNSVYMKLRQRKHAAEENIEDYLPKFDERGAMLGTVRKFREDPESEAIRQQSTVAVREAIGRLPVEYRAVLVARDIDDLSSEETAEALDLTVAAVKSRLHRARLFLRQHLENTFGKGASALRQS